jgi:hypothetical protein
MGKWKKVLGEIELIRAELFRLGAKLDGEKLRNEQLEELNAKLMAERKELLDRVMAVNYERFQVYQMPQVNGMGFGSLSMDQLEESAGEILSGEVEE